MDEAVQLIARALPGPRGRGAAAVRRRTHVRDGRVLPGWSGCRWCSTSPTTRSPAGPWSATSWSIPTTWSPTPGFPHVGRHHAATACAAALCCPIPGGDAPVGRRRRLRDRAPALDRGRHRLRRVRRRDARGRRTPRTTWRTQLQHQALHDPLTGLPNRALVMDRIDNALGRSARRGSMLAVLLLDLDDFKSVNDSLGHGRGDDLLAELALRFERVVRDGDTVARLGGDEFVVVCEDVAGEHDVAFVAEALLEAVRRRRPARRPPGQPDRQRRGGARGRWRREHGRAAQRGGHRDVPREARPARHLPHLRRGDARRRARPDQRRRRAALGGPRRAGSTSTSSRSSTWPPADVVAMEALARWTNDAGQRVPPDVFIPVAEETGLIGELGAAVLRGAVRRAVGWQRIREVRGARQRQRPRAAQPDVPRPGAVHARGGRVWHPTCSAWRSPSRSSSTTTRPRRTPSPGSATRASRC